MDYQIHTHELFVKKEDGTYLVRVTFPLIDEGIVNIDHTYVDVSLRGNGVASEMMHAVMKHIISKSFIVVATCPYAVVWLKRHKEYDPYVNVELMKTLGEACMI
jgi:predicted GNAT family acetyltransferase